MRITRQLLIPTLIFIGLIIAGLITYNTVVSIQQFDKAERERLENMNVVFQARIKAKEDLAIALASEVANNPEVQVAFAAKDRERLIELTLPSYQVIDEQFDVPQFQFHLPPATSFLRLHSLDKYGDDLSSFRFTVLAANAEKRAISGPEIGRGGLGVRGVVPVAYQGEHVGTVEFGTNIDLTLIEALKEEFGYDMQILLSRVPAEVATFEGATGESQGPIDELLFQASTLSTPAFASAMNYQQALAGEASIEHIGVDDLDYAIYSTPLYDYSGNVIGVVDIISNHTVIAQQQNTQVLSSVGILLAALLVVGFGFAFLATRTLRPIGELTSIASMIAAGDFSKRTNVKSNNELGTLAQVFDTMTTQLQELISTLEQRVADRTKALATSAEVSRRLSTILNRRELAIEVVEQIKEAFDYYHAHIYLVEGNDLVMAGGTGDAGAAMLAEGHKVPKGRGLVGRAADSNEPVLVPNTSQDPDWLPNDLLPDTKSEVAIPISIGEQVLGVLDVQHNVIDGLNQDDVGSLQSIANQVAVALQNAQTFTRAERERRQNELILSSAGEGIFGLDKEGNHTFVNQAAADMLGYSIEEMTGEHSHSMWHHTHADGTPFPGEECPIYFTLRDGAIHEGEEYFIRKDGTGIDVNYSSRPILEEGRVTGAVISFTDITQAKREREIIAQRAQHEEALNRIAQKIQSTATIEEAMQIAARELGQALGRRQTLVALDARSIADESKVVPNE